MLMDFDAFKSLQREELTAAAATTANSALNNAFAVREHVLSLMNCQKKGKSETGAFQCLLGSENTINGTCLCQAGAAQYAVCLNHYLSAENKYFK